MACRGKTCYCCTYIPLLANLASNASLQSSVYCGLWCAATDTALYHHLRHSVLYPCFKIFDTLCAAQDCCISEHATLAAVQYLPCMYKETSDAAVTTAVVLPQLPYADRPPRPNTEHAVLQECALTRLEGTAARVAG